MISSDVVITVGPGVPVISTVGRVIVVAVDVLGSGL
jgi:hypothetical protein